MKKKNNTSRAVDSFSASFAHRKPFDSPRPSTTNAVPLPLLYLYSCVVLKRSGLVLLFCLNLKTEQQNQPKTLQNDS